MEIEVGRPVKLVDRLVALVGRPVAVVDRLAAVVDRPVAVIDRFGFVVDRRVTQVERSGSCQLCGVPRGLQTKICGRLLVTLPDEIETDVDSRGNACARPQIGLH